MYILIIDDNEAQKFSDALLTFKYFKGVMTEVMGLQPILCQRVFIRIQNILLKFVA